MEKNIAAPSISNRERYLQIIKLMVKYGFEDLVANSSFRSVLEKNAFKAKSRNFLEFNRYERIRMLLEEMGSTFVKMGQILSNRADILPIELITELEKLQDQVKPIDIDPIETISKSLGFHINEVLESFDETPLAAASISQVYTARLATGEKVIFKVLRPGIEPIIKSDISVLRDLLKLVKLNFPQIEKYKPDEMINSFERSILRELNYSLEKNNISRFAKQFESNKNIYTPKVYDKYSNRNVLCMEFIDGIKINDSQKLEEMKIDPVQLSKNLFHNYMDQIFIHGFFHSDPHPGNLFIIDKDKICFIDYGMMGFLLEEDQNNLIELIFHFLNKNPKKIVSSIEKLAVKVSIKDPKHFEYEIAQILYDMNSSVSEIDGQYLSEEFIKILYKNSIQLPPYAYHLARSLSIILGIALELYPDFNPTVHLKPMAKKILFKKYNSGFLMNQTLQMGMEMFSTMSSFPGDMKKIIAKASKGEFRMELEHKGLSKLQDRFEKVANRIIISIILASTIIGSSLVMHANIPPYIGSVSIIGISGFAFSALLGLLLIVSIIKNKMF
ncbi:ABC1 kinase family protein [Aureibacter tunicatorum]|uniref:Ubiquinone biosynthesis protein n=1 Tax=Aureibacter tunicatorum TaxID=866807 RepID=A0AAE3XS87_9BACT|nr:lipopolysaccharide core heptose(II) kinase RfaY [Aureibacter tunicatorum]MDR6241672.1 ubiquinone biosynthesis protein [Aureibacter tunicatorum]BDD07342.1 ubiquinone biosynthesis protein UbiB [Aureibacter tunicatorum]